MKSPRVTAGHVLLFLESISEQLEMGCSSYVAVVRACETLSMDNTQPVFSFLYHQLKQSRASGLSETEIFRRLRRVISHEVLQPVFELLERESMLGGDLQQTLREVIRRTILDQYDQIEQQIEKYSMQLLPPLFGCGLISTVLLLGAAMMVVLGGP